MTARLLIGDVHERLAELPDHSVDLIVTSGTTLAAAIGVGRDAIGIDLDDRNATLAVERCGMFLEVEGAA